VKLPSKSDLPDEIVEKDKWILWFAEEREGEQTRVPCAPWETDHWGATDATDPDNWTDFDTAAEYADKKEGYGVGFVFSEDDDVVGIDLDDCIKGGKVKGFAATIIEEANSYTEISPSGNGAHVFLQGELLKAVKPEEEDIEVYDRDRFFTVTGRFLKKAPQSLKENQDLLDKIEEKFEKTVEYEPKGGSLDIDILAVVPTDNLEKKGKQLQGPHPLHGSSTGMNFTVDPDKNQWYCHHAGHNCGGGPFEWIAVEEGIIECGSWERGKGPLRGKKWSKTVKAAYDRDVITASQAEMLTKSSEEEAVPFEDKLDEALEDFMEQEDTISVHPVIDFYEDVGLSMGTPLSIEDGQGKAVITEDSLFGGASNLELLNGESPNKELVAREVDFTLTNESTVSKVMQLVVEMRRDGQIENKTNSGEIFDKVYRKVGYYWYHPNEEWVLALACWIVGTYFFPLFEAYPIWRAQGERETGKSTSLKVIRLLAWNPTDLETNLRPAPLYRTVEGTRPTYLVDVTKIPKQQMSDLVDVCESGFERDGSVPRCIGDANKPKKFSTYCPKAVSSRRDLPFDAKAIRVFTEAPRDNEERMKYTERWTQIRTDPEGDEIMLSLMRLALTRWGDVLSAYRNVEQDEDLMGRRFTIWRPLLAVCRTFAPGREDDLRELAIENAEREQATDFTYDVENAVLGFLLEEIPEGGIDTYAINLTGDGSLTEGIKSIMTQDVPWQTVRSAAENLKIVKRKYDTASGKRYQIDVEKAQERIEARNIVKEEGGTPEIDLTEETLEGFDRSQEDKANVMMKIIRNLEDEYPEGVPIENVKAEAEGEGIGADFVDEFIKRGRREGKLYHSSEGEILTAVR